MANAVYVLPVHLLGGVYCDLHDLEEGLIGFKFEKDAKVEDGVLKAQMKVKFDCPSRRSVTGRINLEATGERCVCGAEAERSAVLSMVSALRTQHGFFPADYNYILISEQRKLFEAMRSSVEQLRVNYNHMEGLLMQAKASLDAMCTKISKWSSVAHEDVEVADTIAVCSLHTALRDQAVLIANEAQHSRELVNLIQNRYPPSADIRRFEETVPMPMVIDWAGSYYTLRLIYAAATSKVNGFFGESLVFHVPTVGYKATVNCTVAPFQFWGPNADSELAARSKLMFEVIKHVNKNLGHPIVDLHHYIRLHYDLHIERFDHKMDSIFRCGIRLSEMFDASNSAVSLATEDMYSKLAVVKSTEAILSGAHSMISTMKRLAPLFVGARDFFNKAKVSTDQVKASLNNAA